MMVDSLDDTIDKSASAVRKVPRTKINPNTTLLLYVRAGGHCQLRGCNHYVMEHRTTKRTGNFAQQAHIVVFQEKGPRGLEGERPVDINDVSNLMLLCHECHDEVDKKNPHLYSRESLEEMKGEHEARIRLVTGLVPANASHVIAFSAPIAGRSRPIIVEEMLPALLPRYPASSEATKIDLSALDGLESDGLLEAACREIDGKLESALRADGPAKRVGHISVFAIGPMPLLIYLGARLGDKVPSDLYQLHRSGPPWNWPPEGASVKFVHRVIEDRGAGSKAALLLSLSGPISPDAIPSDIRETHTLHEIALNGVVPTPGFLNSRQSLEEFRKTYHEVQSVIAEMHGDTSPISLFPAVPAPIAVSCGRDRLQKVRPPLRVYEFNRADGGCRFRLEVK